MRAYESRMEQFSSVHRPFVNIQVHQYGTLGHDVS